MKNLIFTLVAATLTFSCVSAKSSRTVSSPMDSKGAVLTEGDIFFEYPYDSDAEAMQRMGMFLESRTADYKGCVMYLQGFGDSMQNHYPMFNKLRKDGYRVISFDYLGQGGSQGSMNQMSIGKITEQAKNLWTNYEKIKDPYNNRTCSGFKKRVIGWSTGGLAAYSLAHEKWADNYVLINPALGPKWCVGETADSCLNNLVKSEAVTFRTLTRNRFDKYTDPHLEKVRPVSPKDAPLFAASLISTAFIARFWKIDPSERTLVLISGQNDKYVDTEEIIRVMDHNGGWHRLFEYEEAYHELDNELPEVSTDVHQRIVDFFNDEN